MKVPLPLTVQLVSMAVPVLPLYSPPPALWPKLPLTVQLLSVVVPRLARPLPR